MTLRAAKILGILITWAALAFGAQAGPIVDAGPGALKQDLFNVRATGFAPPPRRGDGPELFLEIPDANSFTQRRQAEVNFGASNKLVLFFTPQADLLSASIWRLDEGGGVYISNFLHIDDELDDAGIPYSLRDADTIRFSIWNNEMATSISLSNLKINGLEVPGFEDLYVAGGEAGFYVKGVDLRDPPHGPPFLPAIFRLEVDFNLSGNFSNNELLSGLELTFGLFQQPVQIAEPRNLGVLGLGLLALALFMHRRRSA